jgi:RNA polymerase sigma-70 factor (ECF subfamily)
VERLRTDDREAFEIFYEAYFRRIHGFARRRVESDAEAEDLTQEIFLTVMGAIDSYQGRAEFESWVFGVARNVVREHQRSTRRRQAREALTQRGGTPPTPEEKLCERRIFETLSRRLSAVEPWQAKIFALRYFDRLSPAEIARRTERTHYAVSTSLRRLRHRMAIDLGLRRSDSADATGPDGGPI